jgi:hypothetical protein
MKRGNQVLIDIFCPKHLGITFDIRAAAAHADAVSAIEAARVQKLERVDEKGA